METTQLPPKRFRDETEVSGDATSSPSKRSREEPHDTPEGSSNTDACGPMPAASHTPGGPPNGKQKSKKADVWAFGRKGKRDRWRQDAQVRAAAESGIGFDGDLGNAPRSDPNELKKERLPKKKCVMLIGFCGAGYNGMQIQNDCEGAKTIEGSLFEALVKAGGVSEDNSDDSTKVAFARAARTDAGVHAACNAISLKLITQIPSLVEAGVELVSHINTFLPPEIRVWDIVRTNNNFKSCNSRVYEYLFPSYMLMPPFPSSALAKTVNRVNKELTLPPLEPPWDLPLEPPEHEILDEIRRSFRASIEDITRVRLLLKKYEGTHNFHNYTIGRDFVDNSSKRYMINIDVRGPRVYDGLEWISLRFHGQSFMLHQRKMVGLVILAARTRTSPNLIVKTFEQTRIHVPKAPALGLLLEQPQFGVYNKKVEESNEHVRTSTSKTGSEQGHKGNLSRNDIIRDVIDLEKHREIIDEFKVRMIYSRMREEDTKSHIFSQWVSFIDSYPGPDFEYLNAGGVITEAAIQKKGVQRDTAFKEPVESGANDVDENTLDLKSAETDG
ncbi:pseudouridine synthase [Cantharellus anzutake]|uniref:pseudouridine synthase n=1 Tax=Cantharellus anzutake TaxID=1750568 RepID=UPI001906EA92|nr:pseudouridine synthase [Cantharellus anzutake]KAF8329492.1 pseudouridine synthase [Cantharellus anzutake]